VKLSGDRGHLTYCTNVHPGETWEAVWGVLRNDLLAVRADVAPGERFGVGLRLSGQALEEASASEAMAAMKAFLAENDLYVFTMNAFPYGPFHGTRVKEEVYLPDWRDNERLRYTNAAADYLAEILPEGLVGSISTAPGCYKTNVDGDAVAQMTERFVQHAAHLVAIERRTGKTIALAIEPEPSCFLETTEEAVAFFRDHLFAPAAAGRLAELTGLSAEEAGRALRKHLGLCLDLCHAAVEFEDPAATVASLREAGLAVTKLQVSAGLRLAGVGAEARALLAPFDDGVYLHQVVEKRGSALTRYDDLSDAFEALGDAPAAADREWRGCQPPSTCPALQALGICIPSCWH